jgi:hypothetical protein
VATLGCAVALSTTVGVIVHENSAHVSPVDCIVSAGNGNRTYVLSPEQAQNASLIAAIGSRVGMSDHAVTIALATSLVESQLRNLLYGDRDSVGLFQQRPSQGWGTRAQLLDPAFAAAAFYRVLASVPGWQVMAVTDAAQRVQHSASPNAYANWEAEARALAQGLTGETPHSLTCRLSRFSGGPPAPGALAAAAATEFGSPRLGVAIATKSGWKTAAWAVAHAFRYHLATVSFAGWRWTARSGRWTAQAASTTTVVVTPAR